MAERPGSPRPETRSNMAADSLSNETAVLDLSGTTDAQNISSLNFSLDLPNKANNIDPEPDHHREGPNLR